MRNKVVATLIVGLSFIFHCQEIQAQNVQVNESKECKLHPHEVPSGLMKIEGNKTVIQTAKMKAFKQTREARLLRLNGNSESTAIASPYDNSKLFDLWSTNGKNYGLMISKDKKARSLTQYIVEYSDQGEPLATLSEKKLNYKNYKDYPATEKIMSADSSHIGIVHYLDNNEKNDELTFNLEVYDSKMDLVYDYSWSSRVKDGQRMNHVLNYALREDGVFFMMMKRYLDKYKENAKRGKKAVSNYNLEIFKVDRSGNAEIYKVDNEGEFSGSYQMAFYADGTPVGLSDTHSSHQTDAPITGLQFFIWDESAGEFQTSTHQWTESELEEFGKWKKQKGKGLSRFFVFSDAKPHGDKVTLLLQSSWSRWQRNFEGHVEIPTKGAIFTFTFDKSGKKINHLLIPRSMEANMTLGPPVLHVANNRPFVVYNDDSKNLKLSIDKQLERNKKFAKRNFSGNSVLLVAYGNEKGGLIIEEIADTKNHLHFPSEYAVHSDGKVSFVVTVFNGLLKKPTTKLMTFDFSEFE